MIFDSFKAFEKQILEALRSTHKGQSAPGHNATLEAIRRLWAHADQLKSWFSFCNDDDTARSLAYAIAGVTPLTILVNKCVCEGFKLTGAPLYFHDDGAANQEQPKPETVSQAYGTCSSALASTAYFMEAAKNIAAEIGVNYDRAVHDLVTIYNLRDSIGLHRMWASMRHESAMTYLVSNAKELAHLSDPEVVSRLIDQEIQAARHDDDFDQLLSDKWAVAQDLIDAAKGSSVKHDCAKYAELIYSRKNMFIRVLRGMEWRDVASAFIKKHKWISGGLDSGFFSISALQKSLESCRTPGASVAAAVVPTDNTLYGKLLERITALELSVRQLTDSNPLWQIELYSTRGNQIGMMTTRAFSEKMAEDIAREEYRRRVDLSTVRFIINRRDESCNSNTSSKSSPCAGDTPLR